jgi:hypothetical protein
MIIANLGTPMILKNGDYINCPTMCLFTHNIMVPTPILISSVILTTYNNDLACGNGNDNGSGVIGSGIAIKSININPSTKTNGLLPTFNSIVKFFQKLCKNY